MRRPTRIAAWFGLCIAAAWVTYVCYEAVAPTGRKSDAGQIASTLVEGLTALLGLVLAAAILSAQVSNQFSRRLLIGFPGTLTVGYITLLSVADLLALWALMVPTSDWRLHGAMALAGVSVACILPYMMCLRDGLDPDFIVRDLNARLAAALDRDEELQRTEIDTLCEVVVRAGAERNYATLDLGLRTISALMLKAHASRQHVAQDGLRPALVQTGLALLDDPWAATLQIKNLEELFWSASTDRADDLAAQALTDLSVLTNSLAGRTSGVGEIAAKALADTRNAPRRGATWIVVAATGLVKAAVTAAACGNRIMAERCREALEELAAAATDVPEASRLLAGLRTGSSPRVSADA